MKLCSYSPTRLGDPFSDANGMELQAFRVGKLREGISEERGKDRVNPISSVSAVVVVVAGRHDCLTVPWTRLGTLTGKTLDRS